MVQYSDYMLAKYRELWLAFRRALPHAKSYNDAIRLAINSPSSRFWISPESARKEINARNNGRKSIYKMGGNKRKVFNIIYERYKKLRESRYFQKGSIYFVLSFALEGEAPCLYISYERARKIIRWIKNGKINLYPTD